jgi:zinc transporter, ZIP family
VGIAFAMVTGAGLATALGAALVFSERLVALASKQFLAGALAVSAGVMLYVSFIEIFSKSVASFSRANVPPGTAYALATLCLFGGMAFLVAVDQVVHLVDSSVEEMEHAAPETIDNLQSSLAGYAGVARHDEDHAAGTGSEGDEEHGVSAPADVTEGRRGEESVEGVELTVAQAAGDVVGGERLGEGGAGVLSGATAATAAPVLSTPASTATPIAPETEEEASRRRLQRMGLLTAIAIGIHNFPEGIATFVGALGDVKIGIALTVAIAIHNIPEGICVAIPVFYATGSRWKAFLWAVLSGVTEPIGAAVCYAILFRFLNDVVFGIVFGLVAGMMILICLKELIPTALRYDPDGRVAIPGLVAGMAVMALSLVLFSIA